jgi:integrase
MMHSVNALNEHFEGYKAQAITTDEVKRYIKKRKDAKKANATINRELSALKRMFNLARQNSPPKVPQVPHIPMLKENNKRTGFFEQEEYQLLLRAIAPYMKGVIILAYETGMRKEEILSLKWDQVDMKRKTIRLDDTKTDEPRVLKISPAMQSQFLYYKQRNMGLGIDSKFVFLNRDNTDRIRDFRGAWDAACKKAGLGKRHFHDFRRTAIRNMVRAGVAENIAMKVSGHKTRAVFDRYNIVNTKDIKEAMEKTHEYLSSQRKKTNLQVIDIKEKIRRLENWKK